MGWVIAILLVVGFFAVKNWDDEWDRKYWPQKQDQITEYTANNSDWLLLWQRLTWLKDDGHLGRVEQVALLRDGKVEEVGYKITNARLPASPSPQLKVSDRKDRPRNVKLHHDILRNRDIILVEYRTPSNNPPNVEYLKRVTAARAFATKTFGRADFSN